MGGSPEALQIIGEFVGVDRSYIFQYKSNGTMMDNTNEWCREGIETQIDMLQDLLVDDFYMARDILKRSKILHIPHLDVLPPEASRDREELHKEGIKSLICVPLICGESLIGFFGFDSVREEKKWSDDIILLLTIIGEIFANALDRKRVEEALRESEEKYRTILESIEDGYFEVDIAGNFTFFNDSLCKILAYSRDELIGMNNRQYTDEENAKKLYKTFNKVYTTGKPDKGFNWEIIRKDGVKRYVEASVSLRKDPEGQPTGFRGIVRDITERKRAEEKLRESERKYQDLYDNAPDMFVSVDAKTGTILQCNQTSAINLGYTKEEIIGRSIFDLYTPDSVEYAKSAVFPVFVKTGTIKGEELQLQRKDGSTIDVSLNVSAIRDEKGNILHSRSIWRDITKRKQVENEREKLIRDLQKALK